MLRIVKVVKKIKFLKDSVWFMRLEQKMKLNASYIRLAQVMILALLFTHQYSCFFFLSAKLYEFNPNTWVARMNIIDLSIPVQYLYSIYWSVQTLVTAGYGDISS